MTTSSRNYNYLALRGTGVDDMEFVDTFGLDPNVAYTPGINDAMLDITYQQNVQGGMSEDKAKESRMTAQKDIKSSSQRTVCSNKKTPY